MKRRKFRFFGRGRAVDIWSMPHLFFGVVASIFAIVFHIGFWTTFLGILALALFWEWFERKYLGVIEIPINRAMDCVLPLVAFVLSYQLFEAVPFAHGDRPAILVVAVLIFFLINYISWEARLNGDGEFLN